MSLTTNFLEFLDDQLRKPYVLGDTGPDSYDCSGLVYAACKEVYDTTIERVSTDQYAQGIAVEKDDLEPGDIVFFDTGWTGRIPNHNGVYIGDGKFINANSYNGEVAEDDLNSTYWAPLYYGARKFFDADGNFLSDEELVFTDVDELDPNYDYIMILKGKKVITGDGGVTSGETTFRPNDELNRVEALKMILTNFEYDITEDDGVQDFPDVPQGSWYYLYVKTAVQEGIVNGYDDGTFRPGDAVSRAEACKMTLEALHITPEEPTSTPFTDVDLNDWSAKYVLEAEKRGMLDSYGTELKPHEAITRGDMCQVIVESDN